MGARRILLLLALLLAPAGCGANQRGGQTEQTRPASETGTATAQATVTNAVASGTEPALRPTATAVPTAVQPTTTPLPTETPSPADSGTIFIVRDGALIAYDFAGERANATGIQVPGSFRAAPNGEWVALVSGDASNSQGALAITSSAGQQSIPVAAQGVSGDVDWAPDSSAIAYVANGTGKLLYPTSCSRGSEVWVFELSSGEQRKVGDGCNPAWAPDGKRLAYVGVADILETPQNALYLVNRQGQNRWTPIKGTIEDDSFPAPRSTFYRPFWSADGKHVFVLARFSEFAETNWSTIEMVDATSGSTAAVGVVTDVSAEGVQVSPDQQRIVFPSASAKGTLSIVVHTVVSDEYTWQAPWQPDLSATLRDEKGPSLEYAHLADWSPDGKQLVVITCTPQHTPLGTCRPGSAGEARLMDPATGVVSEPLLTGINVSAGIDWTP